MRAELIQISKKEYEGMKETIEILQDPDMKANFRKRRKYKARKN